jgi:phosphoserine / homoserine phosphotransferase
MQMVCLDLEGVLVPEIWIEFAELTGIDELKATTRDIPDYDELMRGRLDILQRNNLKMADIQKVIDDMSPMDGAHEFLNSIRSQFQLVILSDTFYEFAQPLMRKLGWPTLFCHRLTIDEAGNVSDYNLRLRDHKRQAVIAFHNLNYTVFAAGDSYNDTAMLGEANRGFLFRAPKNVVEEFPQFSVITEYNDLERAFVNAGEEFSGE